MSLKVGELHAVLRLDGDQFNKGLDESGKKFAGLREVLNAGAKTAAGVFAAGTTALGALGVSALNVGLNYNRMQQSSRAALTTLLGSAEAANAQMDKLDAFAKNSPFAKQVFITAQQQLLGFGVSAEKVLPTLDAIQNAVAAVGGGNAEVSSITLALAQMQGQGKMTGETLNQLGQYGIDAASVLGKAMGKSGEEIRKLASKPGGIPVAQVWDPLVNGLMEKFGGATANIKMQMDGAADRVKGAFRDIGSALAKPFIDPNGGGRMVEWTNLVADAMRNLETKVKPLVDLMVARFSPALDAVTPALKQVSGVINSFDISKVNGQLDKLAGYTPLIAGTSAALFAFGTGNLPILKNFGIAGINPVVAGMAALAATSPDVRAAGSEIGRALAPVLPMLSDLGKAAADFAVLLLRELAPALGNLGVSVATAGVDLARVLGPALLSAMEAATPLVGVLAQVVEWVAALPTPLLVTVAAFAALHGPMQALQGPLNGLVLGFQQFRDTAKVQAALGGVGTASGVMSTAMLGAQGAAKGLGTALKTAFLSNPIGLAIVGITTALSAFAAHQAAARQRSDEFRQTLDQTTAAITEQTRALMFDRLRGNDNYQQIMENATKLGLAERDLVSIMTGETSPAIEAMTSRLQGYSNELETNTEKYVRNRAAAAPMQEELAAEKNLRFLLGGEIRQNADDLEYARDKIEATKSAQEGAADATNAHKDALRSLIDEQREAVDATLNLREATLREEEAQVRSTEAIQKYADLLAGGEASAEELAAAKRAVENATNGEVRAYADVIGAMQRNGASTDELNAKILEQREALIRHRTSLGDSAEAAEALADSLGLIPRSTVAEVIALIKDAQDRIDGFIKGNDGRTIRVRVVANEVSYGFGQNSGRPGGAQMATNANGSIRVPSFADGKLPGSALIQAADPSGGLVQWAEPETHGEAFIPLAPSKRARSLQIWEETGRRLGAFRSFAGGGFTAAGSSAPVVNVSSPSPDWDGLMSRMAAMVVEFQQVMGATTQNAQRMIQASSQGMVVMQP